MAWDFAPDVSMVLVNLHPMCWLEGMKERILVCDLTGDDKGTTPTLKSAVDVDRTNLDLMRKAALKKLLF